MNIALISRKVPYTGRIELPASKSISNRALIIDALCRNKLRIIGLSHSSDTIVLQKLLNSSEEVLDCGLAGTTFRFLTAYFACREGRSIVLTGSDRMKERPISILVEALHKLGADITYLEKKGYPPIRINGRKLNGATLSIESGVSSQYVSAILMIAPELQGELKLTLEGNIASAPYISMTIQLMRHFGVDVMSKENQLFIRKQNYVSKTMHVEKDWSSASYWYEFVALQEGADFMLSGLYLSGLQGDEILASIFNQIGVITTTTPKGIRLHHNGNRKLPKKLDLHLGDSPDLVPAIAVTCAALGIELSIKGIDHLVYKETDRIHAICQELNKLSIRTSYVNGHLQVHAGQLQEPLEPIATYNDHRMAMAFAPLSLRCNNLRIEHSEVVSKSYVQYWKELNNFIDVIEYS